MKYNFNDCFNRLLKSEGGYTNDPSDSGGPTNLGITLKDYRLHINPNGTANDVRNITVAQARSVYKTKYWDAVNCDSLPSGVDYTCFDYGVLAGVGRPRKALQQFKTLKGIPLIDAINDERAAFLNALATRRPKDEKYRHGWLNRVASVRAYSKVLAGKKDNTTGPVIGTGTIGIGAAISQFWHGHETAIIVGSIVLAVAIGTAIYYFKNKGK